MSHWDEHTEIRDLPFPYPYMIIEEAFAVLAWQGGFLPEAQRPKTIKDVATCAGISTAAVVGRIEDIMTASQDIEITSIELKSLLDSTELTLLDVREGWEFDINRIPGSLLLCAQNFEALLAELIAKDATVVTICHHGIRSYSAALYLRSKGLGNVRSLQGGVAAWAVLVDPNMPVY